MNRRVIRIKRVLKEFLPIPVEVTESFAHQRKELFKSAGLGTTFDDHVDEFHFLALLDVDLHEFVDGFFKVDGGLDG